MTLKINYCDACIKKTKQFVQGMRESVLVALLSSPPDQLHMVDGPMLELLVLASPPEMQLLFALCWLYTSEQRMGCHRLVTSAVLQLASMKDFSSDFQSSMRSDLYALMVVMKKALKDLKKVNNFNHRESASSP
jgi:hypothetical protein